MKKRRWNRKDSERGAVMIIVAFFITAALGFSALAVDAGGWMVSQRSNQNAADAAAYAAVDARGLQGKTKSEAKQMAYKAAVNNTSDALTPEQVIIEWSGWDTMTSPRATATILTNSPNYYYTSNKSTTDVAASSTAQLYSEPGAASNLAIDAAKGILLSDGGQQYLTGNLESGGDISITNYAEIKGDIVVDGNVHLNSGNVFTLEGGVDAGGNVLVNTPMTINGNVSAQGAFEWNSGPGGIVNGNTNSRKEKKTMQGVTVNGSSSWNAKPKHKDYTWRWDYLAQPFIEYKAGKQSSEPVGVITNELINQFKNDNQKKMNNSWELDNVIVGGESWSNGNLEIRNTTDKDGNPLGAQQFFEYMAGKLGTNNLYIPGHLTIQGMGAKMRFDGAIYVDKGIQFESSAMDFLPGKDGKGVTLISGTAGPAWGGGIVNNFTSDFDFYGRLLNLNPDATINLAAGGSMMTVHGAVLSKGKVISNSAVKITSDGSVTSDSKTIRYVNLTNK